jgi:hypothetical protein
MLLLLRRWRRMFARVPLLRLLLLTVAIAVLQLLLCPWRYSRQQL